MRKLTLTTVILFLLLTSCQKRSNYFRITGYAQGGTYSVTYCDSDTSGNTVAAGPDSLKKAIDLALLAIDNSLSGYNKNSILTRVNQNLTDSVDCLFEDMFRTSYEIYCQTEGRFDPSAAPLFDIWGFGFKERESISQEKIDSIKCFIGMDKASVRNGRIIKKDPRFKLNFNAIAQGYSCDLVASVLEKHGICHYLVEVGMEIYCKGLNPSGGEWKIGVDTPEDGNMEAGKSLSGVIAVSDVGIVTSGNYRKFFIEDGKKFSHTIDPILGYPVKHQLLSATIIAPSASLADAYATYCMVIGLEESKKFLSSRGDLKGYLIYHSPEGKMETYYTENLKSQLVKGQ